MRNSLAYISYETCSSDFSFGSCAVTLARESLHSLPHYSFVSAAQPVWSDARSSANGDDASISIANDDDVPIDSRLE